MKSKELKNILKERILLCDGAMGTMLIPHLPAGACLELLNIEKPQIVQSVHKEYLNAGCDIIETNTFGGSPVKLSEYGLEKSCYEFNRAGAELAKSIVDNQLVAGSIGPLGKMLKPLGELTFDDALNAFTEQIKGLVDGGVDLLLIETISDLREMKAAIIASKENSDLPIIATMTFNPDGRTISGTDPITAAIVMYKCGADVIGMNCSAGPKELYPLIKQIATTFDFPLIIQPNAGLPELIDDKTIYKMTPEVMAEYTLKFALLGVNIIGGCCGTTPKHLASMRKILDDNKNEKNENIIRKSEVKNKSYNCITSRGKSIFFGANLTPLIIGERINPSGRKKLTKQFRNYKMSYARNEALKQVKVGAQALDINIGLADIDEIKLINLLIETITNSIDIPLVLDSDNISVLEAGLKVAPGRCLINSVNGKKESLENILPLAKKYGAMVIGLTLNEQGIPDTIEGRFAIAKSILEHSLSYGLQKEDIIIDTLTMTIATSSESARITLGALKKIKDELGLNTSLGVSNISYGLPRRSFLNSSFLAMALAYGLDAMIINPYSERMIETLKASALLMGRDPSAKNYLIAYNGQKEKIPSLKEMEKTPSEKLFYAIVDGNKEEILEILDEVLNTGKKPIEINQDILIPALQETGRRYEEKIYFLPQMLLSAETMQLAFSKLKILLQKDKKDTTPKATIVFATVKGDIHDIGKNIIIALLGNYDYKIIDLGKDVPAEKIIEIAKKEKADIIALSSLMTTTMIEMPKIIKMIRENNLSCKVIVGGAVLNENYAKKIGADGYALDAPSAINLINSWTK